MKKGSLLMLVLLLLFTGCVSSNKTLVRTDPPGAKVIIREKDLGTTPLVIDLDQVLGSPDKQILIKLKLEGYEEQDRPVQRVKGPYGFENNWPQEVSTSLEKKK